MPGYAEAVEAKDPARRRPKASDAFRELIVEPASGIPSPPRPRIILVDSLDEASDQQGETVADVVVQQAPDMPAWLRIIATTRPEQPILERVRVLWAFGLNADRPENRRDVRAYIDAWLNAGPNADLADRLDELATANFLYARMAIDALEDGSLSAQDLGALSPGLAAFYSKTLIKRFPDPEVFAKESLVILRALSVAMGPVPFAFLDHVSRQPKESLEVTNRRLMALRPYLRVSGKGESAAYSLFHKSLAEWLNDRDAAGTYWCQGGMGQADLARACWFDYENDVEQMTEYSLRYAIHHLYTAGRETDARTLNKNTVFRNRRLALGIVSLYLCYARGDDEPFVRRLYHGLQARGFDVWFDRVNMPGRSLTFTQEIRDAISARDRLLLVVGPDSARSEYVQDEWQFMYFAAEKVVAPILRLGDYPLIPHALRQIHCEDFRADARFDFHLANLVRQFSEPEIPLGRLMGVPSLPPSYLERPLRLDQLVASLRGDLDRPVLLGGVAARVGLHGMGGTGKSVLAAALARDRRVRVAFPDGIVWVCVGALPTVVDLQRRVHKDLGGDGAFQTEHEGRGKLRDILKDKRVVLILDDVWRRADVDWFDVLGPRCRTLITTRNAGLLASLGGAALVLNVLTESEAMDILAQAAGVDREDLPGEAAQIVAECGHLPLALALSGDLLRRGIPWGSVLQQLQQSRIERIANRHAVEARHQSVWHAIHASVESLPDDVRQRFMELAEFPPDQPIPETAIGMLWAHTGRLSDLEAHELLVTLSEKSLVQFVTQPSDAGQASRHITLHDLVYDYIRRATPETG